MPNWAYTMYVVKGGGDDVEAFHRVIRELDEREESLIPNGFGKLWAGNLVHVLGGDWEKVYCRGKILDYGLMPDGALRFDVESAWGELDEVRALILSRYPTLKIYFQSEEPDMGIFSTNDAGNAVFHDRWLLDWEDETRNLYVHEYFPDIQSAATFLKEQSIVPIDTNPTEDALRAALEVIWNARPDEVSYDLKEVSIRQ